MGLPKGTNQNLSEFAQENNHRLKGDIETLADDTRVTLAEVTEVDDDAITEIQTGEFSVPTTGELDISKVEEPEAIRIYLKPATEPFIQANVEPSEEAEQAPTTNSLKDITGEIADKIKNSEDVIIIDLYKQVLNIGGQIIDEPRKLGECWMAKVLISEEARDFIDRSLTIRNRTKKLGAGTYLFLKDEDILIVFGGDHAELMDELTIESMHETLDTVALFKEKSREIEDYKD